MKTASFTIEGVAPLILHNARLSDPLDPHTQSVAEITSKRKKTLADHEEIARREWHGGLYLIDGDGAPCVPGTNLERMLRDAATKSKQGKAVQAGAIVPDDAPIIYEGTKDPEKMYAGGKFSMRASCKVGQQRVIRTRPCFREWKLTFTIHFDENLINPKRLEEWVEVAGREVGLGDWRPKHGRFQIVSK